MIRFRILWLFAICFSLFSGIALAEEAVQPAGEEDIIHLLFEVLPATWEGWLGIVIVVCAILAVVLPKPSDDAHPLIHLGYRLICIFGLGVSRLRGGGKLGAIAKIGSLLRGHK